MRKFDLLELPPGSRHNCAYDGVSVTRTMGYTHTLQVDDVVSTDYPVTHVVLRDDVRVYHSGTNVFAIWKTGLECPFVLKREMAKSRGHIGYLTALEGGTMEIYRDAIGDIHWAPLSCVIDIDTGYRIGRFFCTAAAWPEFKKHLKIRTEEEDK